jgi:hypothetical protein
MGTQDAVTGTYTWKTKCEGNFVYSKYYGRILGNVAYKE